MTADEVLRDRATRRPPRSAPRSWRHGAALGLIYLHYLSGGEQPGAVIAQVQAAIEVAGGAPATSTACRGRGGS